jgi:pimeloyl-ACP methyl ester carboxylesterase
MTGAAMPLPHDEAGSGPPLILLHAGIADRTMWSEHLAPLAEGGFHVVALDLPGFGEAPVSEGEQAPWEDVLRTMDALGADRAALTGNSFGGAVALRVALLAPERVSSLALISSPAPELEPSADLEAAWAAEEEALERGDVEAAVAGVVDAWTLPDAPHELRDRVAAMQRRIFELQEDVEDFSEAPDPLETLAQLGGLELPTLVAAGEHDKPDFIEGAERLAHALPRARHELIGGAGHLAPLETPEAFRSLLLDFLSKQHVSTP